MARVQKERELQLQEKTVIAAQQAEYDKTYDEVRGCGRGSPAGQPSGPPVRRCHASSRRPRHRTRGVRAVAMAGVAAHPPTHPPGRPRPVGGVAGAHARGPAGPDQAAGEGGGAQGSQQAQLGGGEPADEGGSSPGDGSWRLPAAGLREGAGAFCCTSPTHPTAAQPLDRAPSHWCRTHPSVPVTGVTPQLASPSPPLRLLPPVGALGAAAAGRGAVPARAADGGRDRGPHPGARQLPSLACWRAAGRWGVG